jgi:hypothetical protein
MEAGPDRGFLEDGDVVTIDGRCGELPVGSVTAEVMAR